MFNFSELRKHLHQHPEVSGEEWQTSEYLKKYLVQFSPTRFVDLADAGFAVIFESGNTGKTVLIRTELDALPIQEINDFAHKSQTEGISHKCGHDGHMSMLCGVADKLSRQKLEFGKAILLFQPAEETGKGAKRILEDESFQNLPKPDFVFALHNIPKMPAGAILLKDDVFTASVKSWAIKLKGKTAHAASPEHGVNPALAISELIQETQKLIQPNPENTDFQLITPIHINMGELAYGISAGEAEIHFTIRTWQNMQMEVLVEELEKLLETICSTYNLKFRSEWLEEFYANQNNSEAMSWLRKVAKEHQFKVQELSAPFKFGEDFGLFTTKFKGAMFGLGAGENHPELHNPDYDFPDEIAPIGIQMFESLIREIAESD